MTASEAMAIRRSAADAHTISYMGENMTLLATGKDNDGQFALIEGSGTEVAVRHCTFTNTRTSCSTCSKVNCW